MKKVISIIFFATFLAFPLYAGKIYIWIDENGVHNITDRPPTDLSKVIETDTFKTVSTLEILNYETQERLKQIQSESAVKRQQQIDSYIQSIEESQKRSEEKYQKELDASRLERAQKELKRAEERQEELADKRRNSQSKWEHRYYNDIKKKQDKIVDKRRHELLELENKR